MGNPQVYTSAIPYLESLGLVRHWDIGPDGKKTMAAVCMEGKRVVMRIRNRDAYTWPPIRNETRHRHNSPVEQKGHEQKEVC